VEISQEGTAPDVFRALGDPVRWSIVLQIAAVDELPCADLEQTLPVSKPTISYHTKILQQAGLLTVRKDGRNCFYALRRDVLRELQDALWRLAPAPRPVVETEDGYEAPPTRPRSASAEAARPVQPQRRAVGDDEMIVLTW
jgi:DNA-binding transcriptional ArsR family regulator